MYIKKLRSLKMKKNQHSTSLSKLLLIALIALSSVKVQAQDPFIAEIRMFAGNFATRGWAFCEGQLMAINSNQAFVITSYSIHYTKLYDLCRRGHRLDTAERCGLNRHSTVKH